MGVKLGDEMKLYYCAAGIGGSPTWAELAIVRDVKLNTSKGEADVTTRASGGWKQTVGTLKDAGIEFEVVWDTADAGFQAVMDAYFDDTLIGLAVTDGPIETPGTQVFKADCAILKFDRNEPLENAVTVSVTAKPTYSTNQPVYEVVVP
ncbi:MAG TPA: phage tail tube protein [Vicinamibacterales bacterium]|nr:phage tail tube protein [Vicinamibacterales bacterium]